RDTVMVRPVIAPHPVNTALGSPGLGGTGRDDAGGLPAAATVDGYELAVDLRRPAPPEPDVDAALTAAPPDAVNVSGGAGGFGGGAGYRVWLEPWVPGSGSCVWRLNALYWQALAAWEKTT